MSHLRSVRSDDLDEVGDVIEADLDSRRDNLKGETVVIDRCNKSISACFQIERRHVSFRHH